MPEQRGLGTKARPVSSRQEPNHDRDPLVERLSSDRNNHHARRKGRDGDRQRERAESPRSQ